MPDQIALDPSLVRAVTEEQSLFVLGAGYSVAYGMHGSSAICDMLRSAILREAERHQSAVTSEITTKIGLVAPSDLGRLSEVYDSLIGPDATKHWLSEVIRQATVKVDLAKASILGDLPVTTIVTTNFDQIVELAFDNKLDVRFKDDDITRPQHAKGTRLLKIHGSIADPSSLVLKRDDYNTFRTVRKATCRVLSGLLLERLPILIGYSLEDENIRELIKELRHETKWNTRLTVIQKHIDAISRAEWESYGVTFIEADAHVFIESLSTAVSEFRRINRSYISVDSKTTDEVIEGDHNPFKYFQTDKISDADVDIIRNYFIPIPAYATIVSTASNTIVAGSRGSGKTMLLRYLALEVQLRNTADRDKLRFAGFYVKCGAKLFNSRYCRGTGDCSDREWVDYFVHVFNLALASRMCQVLALLQDRKLLTFATEQEGDFCSQLILNLIRCA